MVLCLLSLRQLLKLSNFSSPEGSREQLCSVLENQELQWKAALLEGKFNSSFQQSLVAIRWS